MLFTVKMHHINYFNQQNKKKISENEKLEAP